MATMIPDLDPRLIDNDGERRVYAALRRLPASYTVLYSYKFRTAASADLESDPGEKRNLEAHHPEIVAQLTELTAGFRESLTPGPHHPPRWRSVLPRIGFGRKKN